MKRLKRAGSVFSIFLLLCLLILWSADIFITKNAKGKNFNDLGQTPSMKTGLLLGTSKYLGNGYINHYFAYRIEAATELLKSGKIQYIVISGDNSRATYDEPTDMKKELIKNGIDSTKIYLDYAGFRTFDSVVRIKEIFSQDSILIISQQFHNERAIYIADKLHLTAYGYNAKDVTTNYGIKTIIREKFARVKVILDFMMGTKPKFLGEKIEIQ